MSVLIKTTESIHTGKGVSQVRGSRSGSKYGKTNKVSDLLDIIDATYFVPFLMASGGTTSRGAIGPGFDIIRTQGDSSGTEAEKQKLKQFFEFVPGEITNIKDNFGALAKLYTTVFMFRLVGVAGWELVRDTTTGEARGFDVISGVLNPNIEPAGQFKNPAYTQYLRYNGVDSKNEFASPNDIVFFGVPDISSGIYLSESNALSGYTIPSEIHAANSYLSLHENRSTPYGGFWHLPENTSDDQFDAFVATITKMYRGSDNYGKSPIVVRGQAGFSYTSPGKDDAPYIEGRELNRNEISGVTGVPGPKYGVGLDKMNVAGLKELRREFYESVLRPVSGIMEEVIYNQICKRLLGITGWRLMFMRPDFTTAIEDASISMRRVQWGEWSPNESRIARGEAPREGGDYYLVPLNMMMTDNEGRPLNDTVGGDEGEMEPEEEDPIPGSTSPVQPDTESAISELRAWRKFTVRVIKGDRIDREFIPSVIPIGLYNFILNEVSHANNNIEEVNLIFADAIELIKELKNEDVS